MPSSQPIGPQSDAWIADDTVSREIKDQWINNGYSIIRGVYSTAEVEQYNRIVHVFRENMKDEKNENDFGDRIGQLHQRYSGLLTLASGESLLSFLRWALNDEPVLFGSLNFERGTQQDAHVDSMFFWPEPSYSMAGCWIALEDIDPDSGPLFCIPGSHNWPFYRSEDIVAKRPDLAARRVRAHGTDISSLERSQLVAELGVAWTENLRSIEKFYGSSREPIVLKAGDVVLWHSLLAHGGSAIKNPALSRRSVVFHYIGRNTKLYNAEQFMLHDESGIHKQPEEEKDLALYNRRIEYMKYPFVMPTRSKEAAQVLIRHKAEEDVVNAWDIHYPQWDPLAALAGLKDLGFDPEYYVSQNSDLLATGMSHDIGALHFLISGYREGRRISVNKDNLMQTTTPISAQIPDAARNEIIAALSFEIAKGLSFHDLKPRDLEIARHFGLRPALIVGDSHSALYLDQSIIEECQIFPYHGLCSGGSAKGLYNENSRSQYGTRIKQFIGDNCDFLTENLEFILFKFGQADIEFVFNYTRIVSENKDCSISNYISFIELSMIAYFNFLSDVRGIIGPDVKILVASVFPPALNDELIVDGYMNGHVAFLNNQDDLSRLRAGLSSLQFLDFSDRTLVHRVSNAILKRLCLQNGFVYFDDFTNFINADVGLLHDDFRSISRGSDHHIDFHAPQTRIAARRLFKKLAETVRTTG